MWTWSQCRGSVWVWKWTACLCPIHFSRDTINSPGTNVPPHAHTTSKVMSAWHPYLYIFVMDKSSCFFPYAVSRIPKGFVLPKLVIFVLILMLFQITILKVLTNINQNLSFCVGWVNRRRIQGWTLRIFPTGPDFYLPCQYFLSLFLSRVTWYFNK